MCSKKPYSVFHNDRYYVSEHLNHSPLLPEEAEIEWVSDEKLNQLIQIQYKKVTPTESDQGVLGQIAQLSESLSCVDFFFEIKGNQSINRYRDRQGIVREDSQLNSITPSKIQSLLHHAGIDDIDEKGIEQGSLRLRIGSVDYRFRISILKTPEGRSIALRHINQKESHANTPFPNWLLEKTTEPKGLMLIAGTTGSGKTTSMSRIIKGLKRKHLKIISIEDPVEFRLEGVSQSEASDEGDWSIEKALPYLLRSDPDVLIIGEIRSSKSAILAVRAAITGHPVYATIHGNNRDGILKRLRNFGISKSLINETLNWILIQRLESKSCSFCEDSLDSHCFHCGGSKIVGREAKFKFWESSPKGLS